jgi:hypothetical protein
VFSVDIDNIQEFSRRRATSSSKTASSLPHHVVKDSKMTLEECLKMSDTVITGVPSKGYKVKTDNLRDGVVAINFSSEKNFEANIKDKVRMCHHISPRMYRFKFGLTKLGFALAGINILAINWENDNRHAATEFVRSSFFRCATQSIRSDKIILPSTSSNVHTGSVWSNTRRF